MKQQSEEWFLERAGCVTASKFKDVMAVSKKSGKPLKARADYLIDTVTERMTGQPLMTFTNAAMQWGIDNEPAARLAYEIVTGNACLESSFIKHPSMPFVGCSPDGLIDSDGGTEYKCPANSANHMATLINNTMPTEHTAQVQGCMWVADCQWWDFVSYDPRMPKHLQLFIQRIERDDTYISELSVSVSVFLKEVTDMIDSLPKAPTEDNTND